MKAIVLDFDKTLGYFEQLHKIFLLCQKKISIRVFLLLFPEVFRPYIFEILNMISKKKGEFFLIIYTNNSGPRYFINEIIEFINKKYNCNIFDKIIYGYKTADGKYEDCRFDSSKRFEDLYSCTGKTFTNILFLDDSLHINMIDDRIEYLQIEPYYYNMYNNIHKLNKFLNNSSLQNLKVNIKCDNIPKSCNNSENKQIFKAIYLFTQKGTHKTL